MKNKIILACLTFIVLSMSACSTYVEPRHHYSPHYRTYQDKDHGGMDIEHGGLQFQR